MLTSATIIKTVLGAASNPIFQAGAPAVGVWIYAQAQHGKGYSEAAELCRTKSQVSISKLKDKHAANERRILDVGERAGQEATAAINTLKEQLQSERKAREKAEAERERTENAKPKTAKVKCPRPAVDSGHFKRLREKSGHSGG